MQLSKIKDRPGTLPSAGKSKCRLSVFRSARLDPLETPNWKLPIGGLAEVPISSRRGDSRARTGNLRLAKAALSQLSYTPENRVRPIISRLVRVRSVLWA